MFLSPALCDCVQIVDKYDNETKDLSLNSPVALLHLSLYSPLVLL